MPRAFARAATSELTIELGLVSSKASFSVTDGRVRRRITDGHAHGGEQGGAGGRFIDRGILEEVVEMDVEDARDILRPLHVATGPKEALGDTAQHAATLTRDCCCCCSWSATSAARAGPASGWPSRRAPDLALTAGSGPAPREWALAGAPSESTQVSLDPPPWLELTIRPPEGSATRVRPPGTTQISVPSLMAKGRRSRWRGASRPSPLVGAVDRFTISWAIHCAGLRLDRRAGLLELLVAGVGTHENAVATRSGHRFEHQLVQVGEHVGQLVGLLQPVGLYVGKDRRFAQVVGDHVGNVGVGELVVGHPVTDGIGQGDVPRPSGVEDARAAHHRVRPKVERVEELVVDPPIHNIHPTLTFGRAHVDHVFAAGEVAALHQLDPHLTGQKGMLEIRRVKHPRRKHDHRRTPGMGRRSCSQCFEQIGGIAADGAHGMTAEQFRKHPGHHATVFDHVRHAGGDPDIVLQDPETAVDAPHNIDPSDVNAYAVGGFQPVGGPMKIEPSS